MICFIALPILLILGIFSASYRKLALEAIDCVVRKLTLRKCHSRLDERIKARITGKLMKRSQKFALLIYKYFEVIAWAFVILFLVSGFFTAQGVYNYVKYGNCNGPDSQDFCIFNPTGNLNDYSEFDDKKDLIKPGVDNDPYLGEDDARVTIIEYGCYSCPFTKEAQSNVIKVLEEYGDNIKFVFRNFVLDDHAYSREAAEASECADEQGKFWEYHQVLFDEQNEWKEVGYAKFLEYAQLLELNETKFSECYISRKYREEVENDHQDGIKSNIYGTPTFFINNEVIVGPEPFKEFKKIIDKEL